MMIVPTYNIQVLYFVFVIPKGKVSLHSVFFVYVYFQDVNKDNVTMKVKTYVGTLFFKPINNNITSQNVTYKIIYNC